MMTNLPIKRNLVTALITIGGLVVGYSSGFLSSTLQDGRPFRAIRWSFVQERKCRDSQLLGISTKNDGCEKPLVRVADKIISGSRLLFWYIFPVIWHIVYGLPGTKSR